MRTGETCEKCGRTVYRTIRGLCGYCAHATQTDGDRAQQLLQDEKRAATFHQESEASLTVATFSERVLARLRFERWVWAQRPIEAR